MRAGGSVATVTQKKTPGAGTEALLRLRLPRSRGGGAGNLASLATPLGSNLHTARRQNAATSLAAER
jgi:hypothetical protein